ncbi:hypothetical protein [Bradyrhizobium sp. Leo170]|uniref:hypothetical protein n=1 Tax=Bradyrhizobium sp. Leo170 TaxID=1571199 RepID=UPI001FE1CC84|nr:hypothetical protein [Bradyrhizobium sp. Leo170]
MVVLVLADLKPFAAIESAVVVLPTVRPLRAAIEHAEHLPAVGDALIDLADRREGHERAPFRLVGPERGSSFRFRHRLQLFLTPPPRPPLPSGRVKGRGTRAKLHL